jgi:ubiquitin-activating enzyme E1
VNGNQPSSSLILHISNDKQAVVTVFDENPHGFEDGNTVKFQEVEGMSEINGREFKVKVNGKSDLPFKIYPKKKPNKIFFIYLKDRTRSPSTVIRLPSQNTKQAASQPKSRPKQSSIS